MAANFTTRMRLLEWWREGDKNTERQKHMNINETHGAKTWTEKDKMGKKNFFFEMQHMWDELGQDMQLQWTEGNNYRK